MILSAILFPPFLGFLFNSLSFKSSSKKRAGLVAVLAPTLSFVFAFSYALVFGFQKRIPLVLWEWMSLGELSLSFSFLLDPLSLLMCLLITGVGSLIHFYSFFYMLKDPGFIRYFSYLNLFIFMMLILVLSDNLPLLFVGWEGVGLCSYLLIGFWFKKEEKTQAGLMAFIVNRIGDACLLLGIFLLFSYFKTFQFSDINLFFKEGALQETFIIPPILALSAILIFLGAVGKSAQIPLYFWLPKAMAGPTPVSALIHAATMVTAGVYLLIRLSYFYMAFPWVLELIAWVGAFTALGSALIACKAKDFKGVLAYSTISQLAYLFMAVGVQAFSASLFHLLTHGFFKALLFLCAASVIKALDGEQNIKKMGGLAKEMPFTFRCYLAGALALAALPPFSGFFSKDEILWSLFSSSHYAFFALALFTGLLTCFYMTRLTFYVFFAKQNKPASKENKSFKFPLLVLAILSAVSGLIGIPHLFSKLLPFHPPHFLHQILKEFSPVYFKGALWQEALIMFASTGLGFLVIVLSFFYYSKVYKLSFLNQSFFKIGEEVLESAFYVPNLVSQTQVFFIKLSKKIFYVGEILFFSQMAVKLSSYILSLRKLFSHIQNSNLQSYTLYFTLGLTIMVLLLFIN